MNAQQEKNQKEEFDSEKLDFTDWTNWMDLMFILSIGLVLSFLTRKISVNISALPLFILGGAASRLIIFLKTNTSQAKKNALVFVRIVGLASTCCLPFIFCHVYYFFS